MTSRDPAWVGFRVERCVVHGSFDFWCLLGPPSQALHEEPYPKKVSPPWATWVRRDDVSASNGVLVSRTGVRPRSRPQGRKRSRSSWGGVSGNPERERRGRPDPFCQLIILGELPADPKRQGLNEPRRYEPTQRVSCVLYIYIHIYIYRGRNISLKVPTTYISPRPCSK